MKNKSHFHTENHIRELREKRGWSSRELARRMGASAMHMGRLESGKSPLTKDWILKLAATLDVNSHKIANLPLEKELPKGHDDTLLGCAIGWLLESADKEKITLSREELSKWAGHVYNEALKQKLNYQQTRYLAETIVLVLESTRKEKKAGKK